MFCLSLCLAGCLLLGGCSGESSTECGIQNQNQILHGYLLDRYLWYDQVPTVVDYSAYASPYDLLSKLRYKRYDKWSYITTVAEYNALFERGAYVGFGFSWGLDDQSAYRVNYVYKNSPAERAGLARGDRFLEINDQTMKYLEENKLLDAAFGENRAGVLVRVKVRDVNGLEKELNMAKEEISMNTVLYTDVLTVGDKKVGYLVFTSFLEPSRAELKAAFLQFKQAGVNELVLDLRYNGGGRLGVAQLLAELISGSSTEQKIFIGFKFNDKHSELNQFLHYGPADNALGLDKVYVIASNRTCSASETVIVGLKPFVDVVIIGANTCGKPVGMVGARFCDLHVSAIEFETVNALGEGGYFDGLAVTCSAKDDLEHAFGDVQEQSLQEALYYIKNQACSQKSRRQTAKDSLYTGFAREIGAL
jgi:C-terminal processing protease CtpA/Prc